MAKGEWGETPSQDCDWRTGDTEHVSELGADVAAGEMGVL